MWRSNFHNPVMSAAEFWASQSDYQLQQADFSRSACKSEAAHVIVSGSVASFLPDSVALGLLLEHHRVSLETSVAFLSQFSFHGVAICRENVVLLEEGVYQITRIICVGSDYYVHLRLLAEALRVDGLGMYYILPSDEVAGSTRLLKVSLHTSITGMYAVPDPGPPVRTVLVPKW